MTYGFEDHCWKDIVDADVLRIYEAYRRQTYIGARPALLAIDLYNVAYMGGAKPVIELQSEYPSSCGIHAWEAIEPTKRLFAAARSLGIPIIYTTGDLRMRSGNRTAATAVAGGGKGSGGTISATNRRGLALGPDAFEIYEAFRPEQDDYIVYKTRASAFYGTPLGAYLTMNGIDSLIVCGESTSGCVRASVVDGYSAGYHVTVVEECCYDRSPISHKINLFDMHHKYADVMHIDETLDHLAQRQKLKPAR